MRMRGHLLAITLIVHAASLTGAASAADDGPTTAPAVERNAAAILERILQCGGLLLASDDASGEEDPAPFSFTMWLAPSPTPNQDGAEGNALDFRAKGKEVSLHGRSKDDLPYFVARDGCLVQLDPKYPGSVLFCTGGMISADVGGSDTGLRIEVRYTRKVASPGVRLDLAPILKRVLERATESKVQEKSRSLMFAVPERGVMIREAEPGDEKAYPISDVVFLSHRAKVLLSISAIRRGDDAEAPHPVPTADDLRRAGFEVHEVAVDALPHNLPVPPLGFWQREENVAAATKLRRLLEPAPQTQAATRPRSP